MRVCDFKYIIPFYFTNHQAIFGHDNEIKRPQKETKLDIELEMACIIGKKGKDIKADDATPYIFGTPFLMIGLPMLYKNVKWKSH